MENLKRLLEEKENLLDKIFEIDKKIENLSDGFIYHVCHRSYGSSRWYEYANPYPIKEIAYQCCGGEDGIIDLYTNNPSKSELHEIIQDYGAMTILDLDELPEPKFRKFISRSEGFTNTILKPYTDSEE
jgi:hypothetical protein